jgi:iron complex outermembrane receptor protein
MGRGGFRIDSHITPGSTLTLQGDAYRGEESFASRDDGIVSGGNLLARWDRFFEGQSNLSLTVYYDRSDRKIPLQFQEKRNTFDVALQHRLQPWEKHDMVWGFNFRASADQTENIGTIQWIPQDRTISHFSGFLQDDISILPEKLTLTLGTKVEDNTFSDIEVQPNVRIAWMPRPRHTIWGSVARAVRVPSRLDTDLRVFPLPGVLTIVGNPDFDPEEVIGFEGGYRVTFHSNLLIDTTVFHHTYDSLITLEPGGKPGAPAIIGNGPSPASRCLPTSNRYPGSEAWEALRFFIKSWSWIRIAETFRMPQEKEMIPTIFGRCASCWIRSNIFKRTLS